MLKWLFTVVLWHQFLRSEGHSEAMTAASDQFDLLIQSVFNSFLCHPIPESTFLTKWEGLSCRCVCVCVCVCVVRVVLVLTLPCIACPPCTIHQETFSEDEGRDLSLCVKRILIQDVYFIIGRYFVFNVILYPVCQLNSLKLGFYISECYCYSLK